MFTKCFLNVPVGKGEAGEEILMGNGRQDAAQRKEPLTTHAEGPTRRSCRHREASLWEIPLES
ncbi:MAG: hypothetical protein A2338_05230 [Bacteroidetes bacterium RIFOXYB12_FULL_41_6]|nr:MAG: hypothetical protein A2338_05230 [Bacteroidetes bacterium RIFOXYB12_FULL_41_6]